MDNNQLAVINQDAKLALVKTKSLLNITNKILANRPGNGDSPHFHKLIDEKKKR